MSCPIVKKLASYRPGPTMRLHSRRLALLWICCVLTACGNRLSRAHDLPRSLVPLIQVKDDCDPTGFSFLTLQSAIENVTATLGAGEDPEKDCTVRISIPDGTYSLTATALFPRHTNAVTFIGEGEAVNIVCTYLNVTEEVDFAFTWYFDHLTAVSLQRLNFEGCPYPIRFNGVSQLSITHSSFR